MHLERKIRRSGDGLGVQIPPDIVRYLSLEAGTEIIIFPDKGKHGRFISIWRKNQKKEDKGQDDPERPSQC